jgi:CheY-like chemotaxis protein
MSTANKPCQPAYILAVDDSPDNLTLLEIVLDDPHYDLDLTESGREALNKIHQKVPDLVLLDVMMPEMDGFEVARRIREDESLPYIPILLLTAHSQINPAEGMQAGADGFIRKPFDIDDLQTRVEILTHAKGQCSCSEDSDGDEK